MSVAAGTKDALRIVMLTSHYLDHTHGGVESHVYFLSRALADLGHDVRVVRRSPHAGNNTVPTPPPFTHLVRRTDPKVVGLLPDFAAEFAGRVCSNLGAGRAAELVAALEPDVIHHHDLTENLRVATAAARRRGTVLIWTNHLGESLVLGRHRLGRLLLRRLMGRFDGALAPSRELLEVTHAATDPVYCANGVDTNLFRPASPVARASLRQKFEIPQDSFCVVVPRRWAPTKGVKDLTAALANFRDERVTFLFVGSETPGYEDYGRSVRQDLKSWSTRYKIVESLPATDMPEVYQLADLAVFPSILEATSLGILEAMAVRCPVLGSSVGGIPEVVADGVTGFLYDRADESALLRALQRIIELPANDRVSVGEAARELVCRRFTWAVIAHDVEKVYRAALESRT